MATFSKTINTHTASFLVIVHLFILLELPITVKPSPSPVFSAIDMSFSKILKVKYYETGSKTQNEINICVEEFCKLFYKI